MYDIQNIIHSLKNDLEGHEEHLHQSGKVLIRELRNDNGVSFFLALEPDNARLMLMFPLQSKLSSSELRRFPSCKGVGLDVQKFNKIGPFTEQWSLIVSHTGLHTLDVYEAFVMKLCEALWPVSHDEILTILQRTLQKWQNFFSKYGENGLSVEEQRGLFGELYVLRWLIHNGTHPNIVEDWDGPDAAQVDFITGSVGIEVKTTMSGGSTVRISSERQLSGDGLEQLYLHVLSLNSSPGGTGETLADMVRSLRDLLQQWVAPLDAFEDKLLDTGYHDKHAQRYHSARYTVVERWSYRVYEGFPRVVPTILPQGVMHVSYDLALGACSRFRVNDTDVIAAVREYI